LTKVLSDKKKRESGEAWEHVPKCENLKAEEIFPVESSML
jgi:hypothetical protein